MMAARSKRAGGYYWIRIDGEWQPAQWLSDSQRWVILGLEDLFTTRAVKTIFGADEVVIGDKIPRPAKEWS